RRGHVARAGPCSANDRATRPPCPVRRSTEAIRSLSGTPMSLEGNALETWVVPELPPRDEERFVRLEADWGRLHLDRPLPWLGLCQVPRQMASSDRTLIEGWPAY